MTLICRHQSCRDPSTHQLRARPDHSYVRQSEPGRGRRGHRGWRITTTVLRWSGDNDLHTAPPHLLTSRCQTTRAGAVVITLANLDALPPTLRDAEAAEIWGISVDSVGELARAGAAPVEPLTLGRRRVWSTVAASGPSASSGTLRSRHERRGRSPSGRRRCEAPRGRD